jgi:hypothetical protein
MTKPRFPRAAYRTAHRKLEALFGNMHALVHEMNLDPHDLRDIHNMRDMVDHNLEQAFAACTEWMAAVEKWIDTLPKKKTPVAKPGFAKVAPR